MNSAGHNDENVFKMMTLPPSGH